VKSALVTVQANTPVAANYFLLSFSDPDLSGTARPGQFLMVSLPWSSDPFLARPFALFDVLEDGGVQILYKKVGKGTAALSRVRQGDELRVVGPLGRGFALLEGTDNAVMVAGGTGIASVHLLLKVCLERGVRSTLFYGARTGSELVGLGRLESMGLRVYAATEDGTVGHKGLVSDLLASALAAGGWQAGARTTLAFVCGPFAMMEAVAGVLRRWGIPGQFSLESVMACGYGVCQGCVVETPGHRGHDAGPEYIRVCTEGPVFSLEEILWSGGGALRGQDR